MKCSKCGTDYDDSFKFCPNCTEPNPLMAVPQQNQEPPTTQPPIQQDSQPVPAEGFPQQSVTQSSDSIFSRMKLRLSDFGWKRWTCPVSIDTLT